MNIPLDEVIYFDCISTHPSTGAATDADSTPTFAVYEEATDTDIGIGGNLTKRTSLTGNYRGTFTLSAANGFEVGKWYSIIGSATVNGIAGKAVLRNFRCAAAEAIAGKPKVDVDALLGTAWLTPGTAGTPDVNVKLWNALSTVALPPTNAELATALGTADDAVLTQVALVKTKTDLIPTDPADASDINTAFGTVNSTLGAIAGYIDTEVGAIKVKTDQLTFTVANQVDANALTGGGGTPPTVSQIADEVLKRDWEGQTGEPVHCLLNAGRTVMNSKVPSGSNLLVKKEDGTTTAVTIPLVTTPVGDPVTGTGDPT